MLTVYVVSDATGETAERVVRSALVQFEGAPAEVQRRGGIQTAVQIRSVMAEASGKEALVIHTLVSDEMRRLMLEEARIHGVDSHDVLGPVLERLATHLRLSPTEKPGLFQQLAEARSRAIEAVEFAFRHDDGQHPEELERAEVVLVGVSRTMKTPTTLYLAYRGWYAANVPLFTNVVLAERLRSLPPDRVFGLVMTPSRLLELRQSRAEYLGIPREPYASLPHIKEELRYSQQVCRGLGWRMIDVTGKSVEEVTREIVVLLPGQNRVSNPG